MVRHRGKASFYRIRGPKIRIRIPDQLWPCCESLESRLWFEVSGSEESGNVGRLMENYKRVGSITRSGLC